MRPRLDDLLGLRGVASPGVARQGAARHPAAVPGWHRTAQPITAGRGLQFAESRPYQHGDDVRSIDWRVTARQGRPHTKVFEQERERPLWIVLDRGPSMQFGSRVMFKSVLAAQAAAWLAWSGRASGDRVGGWLVDPDGCTVLRPTAGDRGVLALLHALCTPSLDSASGGATGDFPDALEQLLAQVKRGDRVFILSDFYALDQTAAQRDSPLTKALASLAARGETNLLQITDPLELQPPPAGCYPVQRGGETVWIDLNAPATREAWCAPYLKRSAALKTFAVRHGCRLVDLSTDGNLAATLGAIW